MTVKDAVESVAAVVFLAVLGVFALTHHCGRLGCIRYPWAGFVPGVALAESAMTVLAMMILVLWAAGEFLPD